jgi:hypothetical protein
MPRLDETEATPEIAVDDAEDTETDQSQRKEHAVGFQHVAMMLRFRFAERV